MCDGQQLEDLQNEVYNLEKEVTRLTNEKHGIEGELEHEKYRRRELERKIEMHREGY